MDDAYILLSGGRSCLPAHIALAETRLHSAPGLPQILRLPRRVSTTALQHCRGTRRYQGQLFKSKSSNSRKFKPGYSAGTLLSSGGCCPAHYQPHGHPPWKLKDNSTLPRPLLRHHCPKPAPQVFLRL